MSDAAKKAHSAKRYKDRAQQRKAKKAKTNSDHNATTNDTVAPYTHSETSTIAVTPPKKPKITFAVTPQDPINGAGELFGSTGSSRVKAMVTRNRRVIQRKHVMSTGHEVLREHAEPKEGVLGCDSHADTCCLGRGWQILNYHGITVDVAGFSDALESLKNVDIVTGYTAYDDPSTGKTYILHIAQALWLGHDHDESLLCPNQLRANGFQVDDIPLCYSGGKSLNGIHDPETKVTFPFSIKGVTSYLPIRTPSEFEYLSCDKIWLTSDETWNPNSDDIARAEESFNHDQGRKVMALRVLRGDDRVPISPDDPLTEIEPEINPVSRNISVLNSRMIKEEREINTLSTDLRRLDLDPKKLQKRFGGVSLDVVANTLKATTQHAFRDGSMPLSRRYKTAIQQLRYRRLRDTWYSATFKSGVYPPEETDTARSSRTAKAGNLPIP
jgi:hypothetical protein